MSEITLILQANERGRKQTSEDLLPLVYQEDGSLKNSLKDAGVEPATAENPSVKLSAEEQLGARIGHYQLLQMLGEGGCVYMAEQLELVRRQVALKLIKLGMDTKNVIARFEAERQALALMDHPNIAHVFDAGATATGRPYFVMELARGVKITEHCDQNRLQLFADVSRASATLREWCQTFLSPSRCPTYRLEFQFELATGHLVSGDECDRPAVAHCQRPFAPHHHSNKSSRILSRAVKYPARNNPTMKNIIIAATVFLAGAKFAGAQMPETNAIQSPPREGDILTPPAPATPRINGPNIFGVRPSSPFLYSIPATGDRPMKFSADGLPRGLQLDADTGRITGELKKQGSYQVVLRAGNSLGQAERPFKILVGNEIGLTPAMGWNNYNLTGAHIDQKTVLTQAHAMVDSGLAQHGWVYCNTDDGWQGLRGGQFNAIQPDSKDFPDIASMVKEIHGLGLKAGIYSSPWVTTYDRHIGGTSENADGQWSRDYAKTNSHDHSQKFPFAIGKYHFAKQDARQFALWGFDYLKYDWAPVHDDDTKEMSDALRATHRDFLFSLSNNGTYTLYEEIGEVSLHADSWRVTDDVHDNWENITNSAFSQDAWASYSRPGHFNDPDMLVIGVLGWGRPHPTHLTSDEQYTQISMWCLLSAPLLLGCNLQKLDPFTYSLISNDEVLDIDQDPLGKQAVQVGGQGNLKVYAKPLDDGSLAVGLFNAGATNATVTANWADLKLTGKQRVRDLWRQKNLGVFTDKFDSLVAPHGVALVRLLSNP